MRNVPLGPIADSLTHIGQIAMLRRLAGSPVRGESYFKADIAAGRVTREQSAPVANSIDEIVIRYPERHTPGPVREHVWPLGRMIACGSVLAIGCAFMSEREAFGPNLRRLRVKRGVSLESIAAATKVNAGLWAGLERNDFSRWPAGIYARAYVRAYALAVGVDPDATVDEFCRLFPTGDRRVVRVVRQQAALMGHDLRWKDDLVGSVTDEKRSTPSGAPDLPAVAFTTTGRIVAAVLDVSAAVGAGAAIAALMPLRWSVSLAAGALAYHAVSLIALGSTPAVWAIETYLASRHPTTSRAGSLRFLRLLHRSETSHPS